MAKVGRPAEKTDEAIRKIEEVAALDGSIEEMAYYAGIHRATLYRWLEDDKDLNDRIQALRERPILKARQTIVKSLDNPVSAQWYLSRKKKKEFAERTELTGADGKDLPTPILGGISKDGVHSDNSNKEDSEAA